MNKLDWELFKDMFHPSWKDKMKIAIESDWMFDIYQKLKEDGKKDRIVPDSKNVFKVFELTNFNNICVIWLLQDPYPRKYKNGKLQATGIPLDCQNSPDGKLQPSLIQFYNSAKKDIGYTTIEESPSLEYLLAQNILLLNNDLTCKLGKTGSHKNLWLPFQKYLLEECMREKTGIIYVLSGKESCNIEPFINPLGNYIIKTSHPASAAYSHTDWDCNGVFTKINKILASNGKKEIEWDKSYYELPF